MRSTRPISIPISLMVTFFVWFCFLWTMQNAPVARRMLRDELGNPRSSGGLANDFATTVVKFFDDQDPREISDDNPAPDADFEGQIVELMPLPQANREELKADLPEVYNNPSLSSQDLYRSDVDLDGDNDLDMALLLRLSKREAMGAVLEYVGDDHFRYAGKFHCETPTADDFTHCFQIVRTKSGRMHIFSRMQNILIQNPDAADPAKRQTEEAFRDVPPIAGWRILRLEAGKLLEKTRIRDVICPQARRSAASSLAPLIPRVAPLKDSDGDVFRIETKCGEQSLCQLWEYDIASGLYKSLGDPASEHCEVEEPAAPASAPPPSR